MYERRQGNVWFFKFFHKIFVTSRFELRALWSQNAIIFFIITMPKKSHFTWYKTLNKTGTRKFHLYCWDHVCKVHEWCLFDSSHIQFRISTQKTVHNYCIAKCKTFSTCSRLLMAFRAVFLQFNINSNQPRRPNR